MLIDKTNININQDQMKKSFSRPISMRRVFSTILLCFSLSLSSPFIYGQGNDNVERQEESVDQNNKEKTKNFSKTTSRKDAFTRIMTVNAASEVSDPSVQGDMSFETWTHQVSNYSSGFTGPVHQIIFTGQQSADPLAKKYYPNFHGKALIIGGGGGTGEAQKYDWVVHSSYEIVCNDKCVKGPDEIKVPMNYDMDVDKLEIKKLFTPLLYKKTGKCECPEHQADHQVPWPKGELTEEFVVSCGQTKCPNSLGKIIPVPVDFEVELEPSTSFPERSNSRLGLLETGTIKITPKTEGVTIPIDEVTFAVSSGGDYLEHTGSGAVAAKSKPGAVAVDVTYQEKTLTCPITVVAPSYLSRGEITKRISTIDEYKAMARETLRITLKNKVPDDQIETTIDQMLANWPPNWIYVAFSVPYHIQPSDVSFHHLLFNEVDVHSEGDLVVTPPTHATGVPISVPIIANAGCKIGKEGDMVGGMVNCFQNLGEKNSASKTFVTKVFCTANGENVCEFGTLYQTYTLKVSGNVYKVTVSKAGLEHSASTSSVPLP